MLACMFEIEDKRSVSRIINSARQAIVQTFVPNNLDFGHVTRQHIIDRHTTTIARELLCGGDNTKTAILVIDGTYLYIQARLSTFFIKASFIFHFRNLTIMNFKERLSTYTRKDLY